MQKTTVTLTIIIAAVMLLSATAHAAGVAINETGDQPAASAMLDVQNSTKGFLPPRMTEAQKNAISSPATGLMVYQTDGIIGLYTYNGTAWTHVGSGSGTVTSVSATTPLANTGTATDPVIAITGTIADSNLATISTVGKVSNSATSAKNTNTANAIVARDASGNFSAGTITANLSGNVTGNVTGSLTGNADTATSALSANSATSAASATTAGNVTGTVAVANGGTGTTNGSIAGIGALSFAAGGTGNLTLTPGTGGYTLLGGNVAVGGTTSATEKFLITDTSTTANTSGMKITKNGGITGTGFGLSMTVSGATMYNYGANATVSGSGNNTNYGYKSYVTGALTNYGVYGVGASGTTANYGVYGEANGTAGTTYAGYFKNLASSTAYSQYAVYGLASGDSDIATYGGYFSATNSSFMGGAAYALVTGSGNVGIGKTAPAYLLDVAGDINFTGTLRKSGTAIGTGTVTSVTGTAPITVATGTTTPAISLGTVPVANGGTGTATAPTQGGVMYASSTSALASTSAGSSGYLLKSNGTAAPTWLATVPVANGGTGTTTGSITGTSALAFAAGGSNQNVTLTPSGTGYTLLGGNVGIGGSGSSGYKLLITDTTTTSGQSGLYINKTGTINGTGYGITSYISGATTSYAINGTASGTGSYNYGVTGTSNGAAAYNVGVIGAASGGATQNWGLYGTATGSTGTNFGGYFAASGATANYALITGGGNVGIGTQTPAYLLSLSGGAYSAGTTWVSGSDARLKRDIQPMTNYGLNTVMQLNPVTYFYKTDTTNHHEVGFIAQDVQKIIPEVVSGSEGDLAKGETLGLSYGNLVPVLTKAIQELKAENDELKCELVAIKKALGLFLK